MANHHVVDLEQRSFRELLIDLSDRISSDELETLKFYCSGFVLTARREDIVTPVQLWEAVMEKGRMSSSDTTFLQELIIKAIHRNDLLDRVIQYTNRVVHVPTQPALIREFKFVADNVNLRKWRDLVRTLGITDADIDRLAEQYPTNVREQIHHALLLWESRSGTRASRAVLKDALRNCELRLLADNFESLGELE